MTDMNLKSYAYLGDAVWELWVREHTILQTENSKELHQITTDKVKMSFQTTLLHDMEEDLTEEEQNYDEECSISVQIPVLGAIACGSPILAEQNYEEYRCEAADHLPSGKLLYLKAKGNSMEPTIHNGAYVMIREQPNVESGEIAAVLVNGDTEATLKRIKKQGNIIMLMPDNPTHNPMIIDENNPAKIIGKAIRFTQDL